MPDADIQSPHASEQAIAFAASPAPTGILPGLRRLFKAARMLQQREKIRIREEIAQVPGLMALLMKPRNGQKWSKTDRAELSAQLRRLTRLGLYLATAVVPGTSLTLPLLAWWLDQRHGKRA
ncbi:MAG: hypothetical protein Q7J84_08380 [Sulfuricaulis sp.]|nr:hypothetical protein [Sulfuricaulis sp.]